MMALVDSPRITSCWSFSVICRTVVPFTRFGVIKLEPSAAIDSQLLGGGSDVPERDGRTNRHQAIAFTALCIIIIIVIIKNVLFK